MALSDTKMILDELPPALRPALAPLDRRALGLGVGTVGSLALLVLALAGIARHHPHELAVRLLGEYFVGYAATWPGALLGVLWGLALGFAAGWLIACGRNLFLALYVTVVGAIERLRASRDVLDQM